MKKICCSILFVCLFVAPSFAQEELQTDPAAMQTMLALNYCHMSLVKILAYEDRVVLDEEYHNIINNINLVTIQDRELLTVLKSLNRLSHQLTPQCARTGQTFFNRTRRTVFGVCLFSR